ncbi:MAG: hypothetical protein IKH61_12985 [Bacteroidales bacterium]|nr:hypothetical protein [Bacteroidales bacterium]
MKNKEEITLGELIYSKAFQKMLDDKIRHDFKEYDKAVAGRLVKRNPMMRLREMGAEDVKKMTDLYVGILEHKSELPSTLRNAVKEICEPVLRFVIKQLEKAKAKRQDEEKGETSNKE